MGRILNSVHHHKAVNTKVIIPNILDKLEATKLYLPKERSGQPMRESDMTPTKAPN